MPPLPLAMPLAAAVPRELWAALMMLAFLAICVLTMWLARFPTRRIPPPFLPKEREDEDDSPSTPDEGDKASQ